VNRDYLSTAVAILGTLLFTVLPARLPAVDWTGVPWNASVNQGLAWKSNGPTFSFSTTVTGGVRELAVGRFLAELSATAKLTESIVPDLDFAPSISLGTATFRSGNWTLGRQNVSDRAGLVVKHSLDGASWTADLPSKSVWLGLYSPLLLGAANSTVLLSNLDVQRSAADSFRLAAPRVIGCIGGKISGAQQPGPSATAELWVQADGRHLVHPGYEAVIAAGDSVSGTPDTAGGTVDTLYPVATVTVPLGTSARFVVKAAGMVGTGIRAPLTGADNDTYTRDTLLSGAGSASLTLFRTRWMIAVSGDLAGGDIDALTFSEGNTAGNATTYQPVSALSRGTIPGLELGNSATISVSAIGAPFSGARFFSLRYLQIVAEARGFFRLTTGPLSFGDVDAESLSSYLGSEASLAVQWKWNPDASVSVNTAAFVPGYAPTGAISTDYAEGRLIIYDVGVSVTVFL